MMSPDEIIAVVTAFKAGKKLEARNPSAGVWWPCKLGPSWNFENFDYRIAIVDDIVIEDRIALNGLQPYFPPNGVPNVRFIFDGETKQFKDVEKI